jgi:hypothetical protein
VDILRDRRNNPDTFVDPREVEFQVRLAAND